MSALKELLRHGQSYWLDNLTRAMIEGGDLRRRVTEEGLRGVTSNPAIFSKAISKGREYDDQIEAGVRAKKSVIEIYEDLTITDVTKACDVLRTVYDESNGLDGYISLEVSPYFVHDTQASLEEARRLWKAVNRPNLLIKIPGSPAGVPAIEEALFDGINVNVTLLFSIAGYKAVAEAYMRALERRLEAGRSLDDMASVASFFLSRIDVYVDKLLGHRIRDGHGADIPNPGSLMGKAAVANAKLAYAEFKTLIAGDRWKKLESRGASVQRMLWASTSTKDPLYNDVRYVEPLIGPHTVNTMPDETIAAFDDHGVVAETVENGLDDARRTMDGLKRVGVDMDYVTEYLLHEGAQKFIDPFNTLLGILAGRREELLGRQAGRQTVAVADLESKVKPTLAAIGEHQFMRRAWARDASAWTADPDHVRVIENRLGWLRSPEDFRAKVGTITEFAQEIRDEGIAHVVLLGMGGSSLCPEVCARTFGSRPGYPALEILDTTAPEGVNALESSIDPSKALFIVSSKSGTTTETMSLCKYFFERVKSTVPGEAGRHFVAITDPGTPLIEEARSKGFRRCFENPQDIGGRFSAISYFGLVPMALIGMDVEGILDGADRMSKSCGPLVPAGENPGVELGVLLGVAALAGRDKVTLVFSEDIRAFGDWVEQLMAESTGKEGKGLIPIAGEDLGNPASYAGDRVFVYTKTATSRDNIISAQLRAIEEKGHPVVRIELAHEGAVGGEFLRWEVAVAAAGAVLGVNPFDEPNVAESKDNTKELLNHWIETQMFPEKEPRAESGGLAIFVEEDQPWAGAIPQEASPREILSAFTGLAKPGDYFSILAFVAPGPRRDNRLRAIRTLLRNRVQVPTTFAYGPRYLHSTGQLHKGGPDSGVFLLLTAAAREPITIPGEKFGFGTLIRAQALGDYDALVRRGRRVLRVELGIHLEDGLSELAKLLQ